MAKADEIPGMVAQTPFREAAGVALEVRARELFALSTDVLDTNDIERVHDMRVATRRLRAVMEIFASAFPRKEHRRTLTQVKALADALGERRDPDVAIQALDKVAAALRIEDRPGVDSLIARFGDEQRVANERLAEALDAMQDSGLEQRLLAMAAGARAAVTA